MFGFDVADVLAQALDLLLHLDDRHVGDDAERGVEQIADARLAVLARLRPQRRQDELVAPGQLLRLGALLGGVLQDGIDGEHQLARLLVGFLALARILRLDGCGSLRRGLRRGRSERPAGLATGSVVSATFSVLPSRADLEIRSAMPSRCALWASGRNG